MYFIRNIHRTGGIYTLSIQIVCDRPDFVVCVKKPGISAEGNGLPKLLCAQENYPALYPVHRLDKGTGGLTVLAKTQKTAAFLSEIFSGKRAAKKYICVVRADSIDPSGEFSDLLYHDRQKNKTYVVQRMRKGVKKAFCTWELLDTAVISGETCRLIRVFLHSGRTHQIRVQFASRGMPLYGDRHYGSTIKAPNFALWASELSFPDPEQPDRILSFRSDPPETDPWILFSDYRAECSST